MSTYKEWGDRHEGFKNYAATLIESLSNEALKALQDLVAKDWKDLTAKDWKALQDLAAKDWKDLTAEDWKALQDLAAEDWKDLTAEDWKALKAFKDWSGDLCELTTSLEEFTRRLFTFFLDGFSDFFGEENKEIILIPSAEYPPEYVLQKILQQASFDLTVIQRLGEQRKNAELSELLKKYDELALAALSIAFPGNKETWLIDRVKPFLYFQRDTSVRIIPYANALLIGVPFSSSREPIPVDLLSIPHEIGHHIYQTGWISKTEPINLFFEKYFADQPVSIQNQVEEIFADLYGFLVGGPIVALSLQEVLLDNVPGSLWDDDVTYPSSSIRPLIFSELFKSPEFNNGGFNASEFADKLVAKWEHEGKKRGFAGKIGSATDNKVIDPTKTISTLGFVLKQMYDKLNDKTRKVFDFPASFTLNKNLQPWRFFPTKEPAVPTEIQINFDDPFANFRLDDLRHLQENKIAKMRKILDDPKFKISREDQNAFWLTGQIKYWTDQADLPALQPNIWKLVFTAFNWAEQGPEDSRPV